MKCTGSRRYDQLKTGFQPDTVHATSPVIFGAGNRIAPEQTRCHYGIESDSWEATETANDVFM